MLTSECEERTIEIGRIVGEHLQPGDAVLLIGELGAGKTRFVQGMAQGIGAPGLARSPTFVLVNEYEGRLRLLHSDLYRVGSAAEVDDLGLAAAIEWQAQDFSRRMGIRCGVDLPDEAIYIAPEMATDLFRVCQELLTNVSRHAHASRE